MNFLGLIVVAVWLGVSFSVVGLVWLTLRRLKRIEENVRILASKQEVTPVESSDKAFVRNLALAYVAALLILAVLAATAFPSSEPDTIIEYQPLPNEGP
ncbi:MAG TPA: hypothetical protein VNA87_04870 [Actinomycetota bacterium]|nr:hypothetical protein [Actinomycetota bacterium]